MGSGLDDAARDTVRDTARDSGLGLAARALVTLPVWAGVGAITAASILASVLLTLLAVAWYPDARHGVTFLVAVAVPAAIAPLASFPHLKLLRAFAEERRRVRILSGLLPICAWCKKVRDDAGYWQQIERYVSERSRAEFTHGICPDCFGQLGVGPPGR